MIQEDMKGNKRIRNTPENAKNMADIKKATILETTNTDIIKKKLAGNMKQEQSKYANHQTATKIKLNTNTENHPTENKRKPRKTQKRLKRGLKKRRQRGTQQKLKNEIKRGKLKSNSRKETARDNREKKRTEAINTGEDKEELNRKSREENSTENQKKNQQETAANEQLKAIDTGKDEEKLNRKSRPSPREENSTEN